MDKRSHDSFVVYSDDDPARWQFALTFSISVAREHYAAVLGVPLASVHWRWA